MQGLEQLLFPLLILIIFYFFLIRPQAQKQKQHAAMVTALRRGDQVVTAGGIKGKVTKVLDGESEIEVEIAPGVNVRVIRSTIQTVVSKTEPAKA